MHPRLILASGSPRRRDLLAEAGIKFEVVTSAVAESTNRALTTRELAACNAARKASAVARMHKTAVVLGADTLVSLNGEAIGKPRSLKHARSILRRLSGREHEVCTAVCLLADQRMISFHVVSHVRFQSLSEEQIVAYLAKIDPLDKAGAYAAQGHGGEIIRRIRGSYTNVVGLPMGETLRALAPLGITAAQQQG